MTDRAAATQTETPTTPAATPADEGFAAVRLENAARCPVHIAEPKPAPVISEIAEKVLGLETLETRHRAASRAPFVTSRMPFQDRPAPRTAAGRPAAGRRASDLTPRRARAGYQPVAAS